MKGSLHAQIVPAKAGSRAIHVVRSIIIEQQQVWTMDSP